MADLACARIYLPLSRHADRYDFWVAAIFPVRRHGTPGVVGSRESLSHGQPSLSNKASKSPFRALGGGD